MNRLTNIRASQTRKKGTPGPEGSVGKLAMALLNQRMMDFTMDLMGPDAMLYPSGYPMSRPTTAMDLSARIYVAGHRGLVGSAIVRNLKAAGHENLLLRTHAELDLGDERATRAFFEDEAPEYVFLAAAKNIKGEDVIIVPAVSDEAAKAKYPNGWKAPKPYLRIVPQPKD